MFLRPQKPSWTGKLKPHGLYSLLWAAKPQPCRAAPFQWPVCAPAGTRHHLPDFTVTLQASNTGSSKHREARAAPEAGMQWDTAATWHQGMGHSAALHRALGGQTAGGHHRLSSGCHTPTQAGGSCGIHPDCPLAMPAFSPEQRDSQHLWFLQWHIPAFHTQQSCHHCSERGAAKPFISSSFICFKLS